MDKTQADAIAQAILEPGVHAQEEIRRKRNAEAHQLAQRRQAAWFALAGCGIGSIAVYFIDMRLAQGILWGGISGLVLGKLVIWLRSKSHVA